MTTRFFRFVALIIAVLFLGNSFAGTLDTLRINSPSMHKTISAVIVLPDAYQNSDQTFSVVYLLHGHSGSYKDWPAHVNLPALADRYGFILVCPDGGYDSWYLDSPIDPASQYETHIIKEVIPYIDGHYRSIKAKEGRAITGLSMGGHGALYLAMRHASLFYAASSMSGGVDLTFWPERWGKPDRLGPIDQFEQRWKDHSVLFNVPMLKNANLALMLDCGVDDFFVDINRHLHQKLLKAQVDHDYIERPGTHTWDYLTNALEYHLLFFKKMKNKMPK
ncbi:MAG: hypothetical protein J7L94_01760 [Caldisericaceae bacterium]|nr:hypothetical protein [Caldisericaceae bacterium]